MPDEVDDFQDPTREVDSRQLVALAARASKPTEELRLEDLVEIVKAPPKATPKATPPAMEIAIPRTLTPTEIVRLKPPAYPIYRSRSRLPLALGCLAALGALAAAAVLWIL